MDLMGWADGRLKVMMDGCVDVWTVERENGWTDGWLGG